MLDDDMKAIISQANLSFVATVNGDGSPNLSPKSTLRPFDDNHLISGGHIREPILENIKISVPGNAANALGPHQLDSFDQCVRILDHGHDRNAKCVVTVNSGKKVECFVRCRQKVRRQRPECPSRQAQTEALVRCAGRPQFAPTGRPV